MFGFICYEINHFRIILHTAFPKALLYFTEITAVTLSED